MKILLEMLRDLVLMRRGPQDLPYAPNLLGALLIAAIVLDVAMQGLMPGAQRPSLAAMLATAAQSNLLLLALPYVLLRLRKLDSRFVQTGIALLGTGMVLQLLALPAVFLVGPLDPAATAATPGQGIGALMLMGLLLWLLLVQGHILRHALEVRFAIGVLLALSFVVVQLALKALLSGGAA
jgi:hypothetical protein